MIPKLTGNVRGAAEQRIADDRERIKEIDAALPELEQLGHQLLRHELPSATPEVPGPPESKLIQLKRAEDIRRKVREIAPGLPADPLLADIEAGLADLGFEVNLSTLRKNLTEMIRQGDTLGVTVEGRGRRKTVYRKL